MIVLYSNVCLHTQYTLLVLSDTIISAIIAIVQNYYNTIMGVLLFH